MGFDPFFFFFRSGRHHDVNHCHKAGPWGVGVWHDSCRAVRRLLFVFSPLQTSFRWSVCGASLTGPASARVLPSLGFYSFRRFTNAFPTQPNSLLKVILNKSLSLPSSLSQRLLDRKIKRLPLPLIVIGSYSFGAFHTVFQGQKALCLDFLCCCWHLVGTIMRHCLHLGLQPHKAQASGVKLTSWRLKALSITEIRIMKCISFNVSYCVKFTFIFSSFSNTLSQACQNESTFYLIFFNY